MEVTDELLQVLKDYCDFYISGADAIERIIELHEANKPTREPLSEDEVWRIYDEGDNVSSALEFARAVEKAHGIGV